MKKKVTDFLATTKDPEQAQRAIDEFNAEVKKDDMNYLLSNIKVAAPDVEPNFLDNNKALLLFENDKNALREYYENVIAQRPKMIKEKSSELPYEFDFEVDMDNYDPWTEYKLIYKDLLAKGRAYYILKSIPDWKFLQIGRPVSHEDESRYRYHQARYNYRDSIFNIISQERYFEERITKDGKYKGKSQSIRI